MASSLPWSRAGHMPPANWLAARCCLSAAWYDACFCRHDVMPSIEGTVSRRRIRRRKWPANRPARHRGGAWRHPSGDVAKGGNGRPFRRRRIRRHSGAADRRRLNRGPVFGDVGGRPLLAARLGGTVCGAAYWRHGVRCLLLEARYTAAGSGGGHEPPGRMVPPGAVPPIGGTFFWRHGFARR